jgi:hypothetical protein
MADIPIEHKSGRAIWPWIIGLIILIVILWLIFARRKPAPVAPAVTDTTTMTTPGTDTLPAAAPVGSTTTPPRRP